MVTFLRSPRTASRIFNTASTGQLLSAVPRLKFLFFVEFNLSDTAQQMLGGKDVNALDSQRNLAFKVKSIEKPRITLETEELNQYNKRHLIYKKIDYADSAVKLHDSNDNSVLSFWVDYFTYFFGDSRPKSYVSTQQSPVDQTFRDSTGWGLRPLANTTNFFDSIRVLAFFANTITSFKYMNPKITTIDWGGKDYFSSADIEDVTINFKYEFIEYERFGEPIGNFRKYGWSSQDTLPTSLVGVIRPAPIQPRIFSNQVSTDEVINQFVSPTPTSQLVTRTFLGREKTINVATQKDNLNYIKSFFNPTQSTGSFGGSTPQFGEGND